MRLLLLAVGLAFSMRCAWAQAQSSAPKLAWGAEKIPQCEYASTFWIHENFVEVDQKAWDALTPAQQNKEAADFCRSYKFYNDADMKYFNAKSDLLQAKSAQDNLAVINKTETDTDLATELHNVKTYFGEDSNQARFLGFYTKDFAEKKAALLSEVSAQNSVARGQDVRRNNASLSRAAAGNDAAGLNHAFDNSNAAAANTGAGRSLASVGVGSPTGGSLAAKSSNLSADAGPAPKPLETDTTKAYVEHENEAWFGMKGKVDCAVNACPDQRVRIMRGVEQHCASDPQWCQKAKSDCAESYFGSFYDPNCQAFGWMNDMRHQD